jgi:hypothetical protein
MAIQNIFSEFAKKTVFLNYLDDLVIAGDIIEDLMRDFTEFLRICKKFNISLADTKTWFIVSEIDLLGWTLSSNQGLKITSGSMKKLEEVKTQEISNKRSLQRLLGLLNFFSKTHPDICHLLSVLYRKLSIPDDGNFHFSPEDNMIKNKIIEIIQKGELNSTFMMPRDDESPFTFPLVCISDSSSYAVSGLLHRYKLGLF